jgi:hypothetical protein
MPQRASVFAVCPYGPPTCSEQGLWSSTARSRSRALSDRRQMQHRGDKGSRELNLEPGTAVVDLFSNQWRAPSFPNGRTGRWYQYVARQHNTGCLLYRPTQLVVRGTTSR